MTDLRRPPATVAAVFFDWAGTIIDWGSVGPVLAFSEVFRRFAVEVTETEVRAPMGKSKRDHIASIFAMPEVSSRFVAAFQRLPGEADIDLLYGNFVPTQLEVLPRCRDLIPGVPQLMTALRVAGISIGTSTGYSDQLDAYNRAAAKEQGFAPDAATNASEVQRGRPAPDMLWRLATAVAAPSARACVVVDDTPLGIEAARRAGMWAVGVLDTGNEVGLAKGDWERLSEPRKIQLRAEARQRMLAAGAHYCLPIVTELPAVLAEVNARLAAGDAP